MSQNIALKFYADWCGPCQTYQPIVDQVFFSRPDISLRSINVDQDPHTTFGHGVATIPALVLMQGDKILARVDGVQTAAALKQKLEEVYGLPE